MPPLIVVDSPAALADAVAQRAEAAAAEAVAARDRFSIALPGGSVATCCFPRLALSRIDWSRTDLFFGDDRLVPPEDAASNYGLADRLLLSWVPLAASRIHAMLAGPRSAAAAAAHYEHVLVRTLGEPPVIDLVLLGVGEDGHVASVFPNHPLVESPRGWVASVTSAPKPPPDRLTLTMATLLAARRVLVIASGASKAAAIRDALEDPEAGTPVARIAREAVDVSFVLDAAAASGLRGGAAG